MEIQAARDRGILMRDYFQKKYAEYVLKPFLGWYLAKPRPYKYENLSLTIYPTVFHPAYFFSTLNFVEFINKMDMKEKRIAEVGAGSGMISFIAANKGAVVTAIEINDIAVKGLIKNARKNNINSNTFQVIRSDLFESVSQQHFDYIFINPPYFFKAVDSAMQLAWNCGANGEYFEKLFRQLNSYKSNNGEIFMTLADNCELERIQAIARKYGATLELTQERKIKWEKNFIFKVKYN
jgi:release factor glutamine methyltransferase